MIDIIAPMIRTIPTMLNTESPVSDAFIMALYVLFCSVASPTFPGTVTGMFSIVLSENRLAHHTRVFYEECKHTDRENYQCYYNTHYDLRIHEFKFHILFHLLLIYLYLPM